MVLALGLAAGPQAQEAESRSRTSIILEVRGQHYDVGDPVWIRVRAQNNGDSDVDNPIADPLPGGFTLKDAEGKTHQPEKVGSAQPELRPTRLAPGGYFGGAIDLGLYFPALGKPGEYRLSYSGGGIDSNTAIVNVIPAYDPSVVHHATIKTRFGEMKLDFFTESAPRTVQNFVDLARLGFYDGLSFHYVRPGDMIVGGDPKGDGSGGSGYFLPAEFGDREHLTGTVGMVRMADPNSASSQFYICLAPRPERDGRFTTFAQVVDGLDILKEMESVETNGDTERPFFRPAEPLVIESIRIETESLAPDSAAS